MCAHELYRDARIFSVIRLILGYALCVALTVETTLITFCVTLLVNQANKLLVVSEIKLVKLRKIASGHIVRLRMPFLSSILV